jgi:hypothetical protein
MDIYKVIVKTTPHSTVRTKSLTYGTLASYNIWKGTAEELAALTYRDEKTVYFVIKPQP